MPVDDTYINDLEYTKYSRYPEKSDESYPKLDEFQYSREVQE